MAENVCVNRVTQTSKNVYKRSSSIMKPVVNKSVMFHILLLLYLHSG